MNSNFSSLSSGMSSLEKSDALKSKSGVLAAVNLEGKTLTPGLYKWTNTVIIPTDVIISGGRNDVWIFQVAGNLTMSSAVKITLKGGAQAKNIFWQVAGSSKLLSLAPAPRPVPPCYCSLKVNIT